MGYFNPRTPWGVRHKMFGLNISVKLFQSTHPVGGATLGYVCEDSEGNISIHAPRGGCD